MSVKEIFDILYERYKNNRRVNCISIFKNECVEIKTSWLRLTIFSKTLDLTIHKAYTKDSNVLEKKSYNEFNNSLKLLLEELDKWLEGNLLE